MAQLDPSIILQAGKIQGIDPGQLMEQRAQVQLRNLALQRQTREDARAARQDDLAVQQQQTLRDVGTQFATGDVAGARSTAASSGNFDLVQKLDTMGDAERKRTFEISQATAPLLMSLQKTPPEAIPQAIASIAPELQARGFTPEHIAQVQAQLSDPAQRERAFAGIANSAQTIAEYQKSREGFTLGQDQQRFDADGNVIARGPESIKSITTPEGATTTILGGAGHTGIPGTHVGPQIESTVTGFIPGAKVTSGARTAEHNAAVGGVANSFHLTDDARDFVPPQGMTTKQFASVVRTKMPGFDVIDEGSHVHVEPSSRGPITIKGQPKADEVAPLLSEEALNNAAQTFNEKGTLPSLGMGKQNALLKAKILNKAAQIASANGDDATALLARQAERKANGIALNDLTKRNGIMSASKNTAVANGDLLVQSAGAGAGTTGSPVLNRWQQAYRSGVKGSPEVAQFGLAINTFANEYAKVVSGATGAAGVAEGARQEMLKHLSEASTPEQVRAIVSQAKKEMSSSTNALANQIKSTQASLSGKKPDAAKSAPNVIRYDAKGNRIK